ncbi:RidA family protein [Shinella sp. DD12]|uniref:RidA family protein n=1 Tax=Shinella sp. DD12 TaxID=1410620 RepID=UPI0004379D15|nr:RidA family protein [Shinella sp. DD12]EYR77617.1 reactive intermediate/imine deaminase [Shinella sp. DD12]
MEAVHTDSAPAAIGPYSQARCVGDLIFVSGQLPLDAASGQVVSDVPAEQARQCLANIKAISQAAGSNIGNTIKTTIFVTELASFASINEVYGTFFDAPYPARACVEVSALPKGAKVEIEAIIKRG